MSSVKIQVFELDDKTTNVLVDNKFAYNIGYNAELHRINLKCLIDKLNLDNIEITDKKRV